MATSTIGPAVSNFGCAMSTMPANEIPAHVHTRASDRSFKKYGATSATRMGLVAVSTATSPTLIFGFDRAM